MTVVRFHGPELDAATAAAPGPVEMCERHGVCETALDTRLTAFIDQQIVEFEKGPDQTRAELAEVGVDVAGLEDFQVFMLMLRGLIGGSFTFGMSTALELLAAEAVLAPPFRRKLPVLAGLRDLREYVAADDSTHAEVLRRLDTLIEIGGEHS